MKIVIKEEDLKEFETLLFQIETHTKMPNIELSYLSDVSKVVYEYESNKLNDTAYVYTI